MNPIKTNRPKDKIEASRIVSRVWKLAAVCTGLAIVAIVAIAPATAGAFSFEPGSVDFTATNQDGAAVTQVGSHPYQVTTKFRFDISDGDSKDVSAAVPPGLIGSATAVPQCAQKDFFANESPPNNIYNTGYGCEDATQVGYVTFDTLPTTGYTIPLYNLTPPRGLPAEWGFSITGIRVFLRPHLRADEDSGFTVGSIDTPQALPIFGAEVVFWGVPADPRHDGFRGACLAPFLSIIGPSGELCPSPSPPTAFLTMPTACKGPTSTRVTADSWQDQGNYFPNGEPDFSDPRWHFEDVTSHDAQGNQISSGGCGRLSFTPTTSSAPTSDKASAPTGFDFNLDVNDPGLTNATGISQSEFKKVKVSLPEGMSINPSLGAGLGVCTPAEYARETLNSAVGEGCPNNSNLGSVRIESPLLGVPILGNLYIAQPDDPRTKTSGTENPFDAVVAMYLVAKNPDVGIIVKSLGRVEPNETTGQVVTTFDNIPQLPFNHFNLHFREGQRSPLISPPTCGTFTTRAELTPWSEPEHPIQRSSDFTITKGFDAGPCPSGGTPGFAPKLQAGALNNNAGSFSPFFVHMSRNDGDQEITNFSADLPPGVSAKLAGVPKCSDAQLARMAAETGKEAQSNPACPAQSQVGHSLVGYGVGSTLAYAPGQVFLAGPYHGTPVSIATVAPAVVGPFDLGTVIVRSAFRIDPETAEVHIDSKGSDPIPHILKGFPLHLRDIRVYMDRPRFTINPTDCNPLKVGATLTGSGASFADPADDISVSVPQPFQASNCSLLAFKPKLSFKLRGGTHRGDFPALTATLKGRPGDANVGKAVVTLPHSAFLEQSHIGTVCTRVQFAADTCPAASVYGHVKATTPLLDNSLEGPVYLRSSSHELPDLVAKLSGEINIVLDGRIDSVHGGIRTTFDTVPDTPVTKFTLTMQGGKKGLFVNSRNLCLAPSRADVAFTGQNGKLDHFRPVVANSCKKAGRKKHARRG